MPLLESGVMQRSPVGEGWGEGENEDVPMAYAVGTPRHMEWTRELYDYCVTMVTRFTEDAFRSGRPPSSRRSEEHVQLNIQEPVSCHRHRLLP